MWGLFSKRKPKEAKAVPSQALVPNPVTKVERMKPHERLSHVINAVGFLLAAGTGLVLMFKGLKKLSSGTRSRQLHRIGAGLMIVAPLFVWVKDWPGWRKTWREIIYFSKADREFIKRIPLYMLGFQVQMPPQGKFNAGQKLNFLMVTFNALGFTVTGGLLMARRHIPEKVFPYLIIAHDIQAIVGVCGFMAHAYLALLHPDTRPSLSAIIDGTVPVEYAKSHHALWYAEEFGPKSLTAAPVIESE